MALETPNRLAASVVFYFAEVDAEPPALDNDFTLTITAANGILSLDTLVADTLDDGFVLRLQEKIRPEFGSFFMSGTFYQDAVGCGFTPTLTDLGIPALEEEGNFFCLAPDLDSLFGMISVSCWEVPRIASAELPITIPITP